ncbi:MAG: response regulator [Phycisphaeraceae bacterium]|nr:response regulator [Phycisphaeraceae bacterium]
MTHRALVVEDNEDIAERVTEILDSLGHEYVCARSQEEARQPIAEGGFQYVLLDLSIPVKTQRGLDTIEYGANLAKEMHRSPTMQGVPIIVMTAYGKEGLEIAASLCEHGVVDFINKPFPRTGRTLASVIHSVLDRTRRRHMTTDRATETPDKPFQGGGLVFYADRVELCGVAVVSSSKSAQMWAILDTLKQRLNEDRYRAFPGIALAGKGGQGGVAGSIRDFRRNVAELLGRELGVLVKPQDVIETSTSGYRLKKWIAVKDLRQATRAQAGGRVIRGIEAPVEDAESERQERIIGLIRAGERLRVPEIANRLHCSYSTAKRSVETLKADGHITFVGATKTGYYDLLDDKALAAVRE